MRASRPSLVALAVVATLARVSVALPPVCTEAQFNASFAVDVPSICELQQRFEMCDDACLAARTKRVETSLNCSYVEGAGTMYDSATTMLETCVELRGKARTASYMPKLSVGLRMCTDEGAANWDLKYGSNPYPPECARNSTSEKGCSDTCLRALEQSIVDAPACWSETPDAWNGELRKEYVVECIERRGESVASNAVMNSAMGGDGKLKIADAALTAQGSSAPSSGAPSPSSTSIDTKPPSASAVGATRVASGVVVGGAIVAVMLCG